MLAPQKMKLDSKLIQLEMKIVLVRLTLAHLETLLPATYLGNQAARNYYLKQDSLDNFVKVHLVAVRQHMTADSSRGEDNKQALDNQKRSAVNFVVQ